MELDRRKIKSILLIDDDRDDFELVAEALSDIDPEISVHFVDRCEDAARYRDQSFDLILLDINMPHHDGFSWLKGIRDNGYQNLPIIMYTNSLSPADIVKSYNEGANLYFPKPESFATLKKALQKLIQLDWRNPFSIRDKYIQNGKYLTFRGD
jgi:CheY-like chemotaxis protein